MTGDMNQMQHNVQAISVQVNPGSSSSPSPVRTPFAVPPAPSILGPRPAASAPARRKKALPPNFTPRRSARLSKNNSSRNTGPVQRAQTVLLRRMGVIEAEEYVSDEALDEYLKLFDKPLAPHHIKAVTAIFASEDVDFDEPAHTGFCAFDLPEAVEPCGA